MTTTPASQEPLTVEIGRLDYSLSRGVSKGTWRFSTPVLANDILLRDDELAALHLLAAQLEPCGDNSCPCRFAGFDQAVDTVGEWHRPLGV